MSPELLELINQLLAIDWSIVVGVLLSPVFFALGMWFLIRGPWPWDEKYRGVSLGTAFLFCGSLAAGGAGNIVTQFWSLIWFGMFLGIIGGAAWLVRQWFSRFPIVGQVFAVPSIGNVTISKVIGQTPFDAVAYYLSEDSVTGLSEEVRIPVTQLLNQAERSDRLLTSK